MSQSHVINENAAYFSATVSAYCFINMTGEVAADGIPGVQAAGSGERADGAVISTMTAGVVRRYSPCGQSNRQSIVLGTTSAVTAGDMIMAGTAGVGIKLIVASTTAPVYCNAIARESGVSTDIILCELVSPFKVADKN